MPSFGSLDQDRYTFLGIDGQDLVLKDLPISERSRFLMWYSRFKIQWSIFKSQYPNGSLQLAYDEETLGDGNQIVTNPAHYPSIKWVVDHLLNLAGISINNVGLDLVYALLVEYREQGYSILDQLWLNHPEIELEDSDADPLPGCVDQAEQMISELMRAGYKGADIQYCIEVMPYRELQTALRLAAKSHQKESESDPLTPAKPNGKKRPDSIIKNTSEADMQKLASEFFQKFDTDVNRIGSMSEQNGS